MTVGPTTSPIVRHCQIRCGGRGSSQNDGQVATPATVRREIDAGEDRAMPTWIRTDGGPDATAPAWSGSGGRTVRSDAMLSATVDVLPDISAAYGSLVPTGGAIGSAGC